MRVLSFGERDYQCVAGRHAAKCCSTRRRIAVRVTPTKAKMKRPAKTSGVWNCWPATSHHSADSVLGTRELGDEDADQRLADREPHAAGDERDRAGQGDGAEELEVAGAEAARDADYTLVQRLHALAVLIRIGNNAIRERRSRSSRTTRCRAR